MYRVNEEKRKQKIEEQIGKTYAVGKGALFRIHRGFIWKVLLEPGAGRTVQPLLRTGCTEQCMNFRHPTTSP